MSVLIIAEAGVNHNGNFELAKKLAREAKNAGADYIKYQTFNPQKMVSKFAQKADYQKKCTDNNETQLEMLQKLALSEREFRNLKSYCEQINIGFLSTAFDIESINFLSEIGCKMWKIPSGEITNYPYLIEIAKKKQEVILSTGMSTENEIWDAVNVLKENGAGKIALLHCTTEYPAPYDEVNLNAIQTLREHFNLDVGYSDHTKGIEIAIASVALGATIIEKHFTIDKNMEGPDHKASIEPSELKVMVNSIRNTEKAMGNGKKEVTLSEKNNIIIARKSIVASKRINKGEIFSVDNITTKRPGNGISPMKWNEILGKIAKKDFEEDELIEL